MGFINATFIVSKRRQVRLRAAWLIEEIQLNVISRSDHRYNSHESLPDRQPNELVTYLHVVRAHRAAR